MALSKRFWILAVLMVVVVGMASATSAIAANNVAVTSKHDWTVRPERDNPNCTAQVPCVGDLVGTENADFVAASAGWDWINAKGGADVLYGGDGMDQYYGGNGNDEVYGNASHDHLWGGDGNDIVKTNDGTNEAGHIEEIWADQTGKGELGYDKCWLDADPDGAVVRHCEVLTIVPTSGYSGSTKIFPSQQDRNANRYGKLYSTGTHYNVNRF